MNAISGMTELLLRRKLDNESKSYAVNIKLATANLLSVINDCLDISKIESGRFELLPVTYYLSSLFYDVVNIIRGRLEDKPIRFYTNIDANIPNMLTGDEARLRQILLTLLGNAIKYTEKGYISVSIAQLAKDGKNITISMEVADSGVGIKEEEKRNVFSEYETDEANLMADLDGSIMGLAVIKRLCVAMGGDITLKSEYGQGSLFTAVITQEIAKDMPFASVEDPKNKKTLIYEGRLAYAKSVAWSLENMGVPFTLVTTIEEFAKAIREEEWYFVFSGYGLYDRIKVAMEEFKKELPHKKPPPLALMVEWGAESYVPNVRFVSLPVQTLSIANVLNGIPDQPHYGDDGELSEDRLTAPEARFLVVDDIATNLKVMEGLIAPYQAKVDTCLSGIKAVELVKKNAYDLVFMDHMMFPMDGVEATSLIRQWEVVKGEGKKVKPVPIVALTANTLSGMRRMFLDMGFSDFLPKPVDVSRLDDIILKWLPSEKLIKASQAAPKEESGPNPDSDICIPGVDAEYGQKLAGGTEGQYLEVLKLYCRDVEARLALLNVTTAENNLKNFITQAHALKSASASVGAAEISRAALELESAGNRGDMEYIKENVAAFAQDLSLLVGLIKETLTLKNLKPQAPPSPATDITTLGESLGPLKTALASENVGEVDRLLSALAHHPTNATTKDCLAEISDLVLIGDFKEALEVAERLTE
jgi:CheY-like chemotaxis protein